MGAPGIPGLLQTRSYATAVIRASRPYDSEEELEREAAAHIERQNILARDDPPKLWVVLGEGVLRQAVGGAHVMREQLGHLLSLAEAQGIVLQVLPFAVSDAPGVDGPAALFEFEFTSGRLPGGVGVRPGPQRPQGGSGYRHGA